VSDVDPGTPSPGDTPAEDPPAARPAARRGGIGRASLLLASGTTVSRVLGFLKAIVLAQVIGVYASAAANAFGLANQLPNLVYGLIAGGVLGAVVVPHIVRAGRSADGGQGFVDKVVTLGIVLFGGITLIVTAAAPLLVQLYTQSSDDGSRGFDGAATGLAVAFAFWCLPQIFFYSMYSLLGEIFNARQVFGPFTWAPAVNNVVAIVGILVFGLVFVGDARDPSEWTAVDVALLAGTATLGVAAQAAVLVVFWRRTGLTYRPDFRWRQAGLGATGAAAFWAFGMVLVIQVSTLVNTRVASIASEYASIATLQNAFLVFALPHSVIAVSLATAYFTRMSGHAESGDLAAVRDDLRASLTQVGLLLVFAGAALTVVALPLARVFIGDGSFEGVVGMGGVLIAYLVGLLPYSAAFILYRVLYALHDTRTAFLLQLLQGVVFIGIAVAVGLLVPAPLIGAGLALGQSVSVIVQAIVAFVLLRRRLGPLGLAAVLRRTVQYIVFALVAGGVGAGLAALLGSYAPGGFALSGEGPAVLVMAVCGVVMALVYVLLLRLARNPELDAVLGPVFRRLTGRRARE
jgi:putative peptidoglycan lipid II flippase